ncbi:MAG: hypothetical protein J5629_11440, partial [Muribaculaceae bacterium]|nr:hypothetical protein [Muribaculaceae bacterium]
LPGAADSLSDRASKKPLNSEQGPREPKSDAKLQPIFHMAKCFHKKMRKNREFNIPSQETGRFGEKRRERNQRN